MIRLVCEKDILTVADTYRSLLTYEKVNGESSNWELDVYPTTRVPEEKIPLKQMYVLEENGEICASMVLNYDQVEEYNDIPWLYPAEEALVVHTLFPMARGEIPGGSMYLQRWLKMASCRKSSTGNPVNTKQICGAMKRIGWGVLIRLWLSPAAESLNIAWIR